MSQDNVSKKKSNIELAEEDNRKPVPLTNIKELDNKAALNQLGLLIDTSFENKDSEGLKHGIKCAEDIGQRKMTPPQRAILNYSLANAWANIRALNSKKGKEAWDWEQPEIEKELFHLRSALVYEGYRQLQNERKCQILTNTANAYSHIGRFVEAIEYWDKALSIIESFGMARGNRAIGITEYSRLLYDKKHQAIFLKSAHQDIRSIRYGDVHDEAKKIFNKYQVWLDSLAKAKSIPDRLNLDEYSLGKSTEEARYRKWCLPKRLFLNPLNDLGPHPIAAEDIMTFPSVVYKISEGPYYHGFFNQIKQEYVSSRYIYYEGINKDTPHFSDSRVLLYNTLDYPAYSIGVEKVKAAFRIQYSIFDKVAYLLNDYLHLSISKKSVNFRTIWYEKQDRTLGLRDEIKQLDNWPLRGLFWLSKDLYEDKPGFRDLVEPDAKELHSIRNQLEHRYLKLHEGMWADEPKDKENIGVLFRDSLAYSIYRSGFEAKTLKLIKLVRSALLYLTLAINLEEQRRAKARGVNKIIPKLRLDTWEDDWKT